MRAVVIPEYGPPEVMQVIDVPNPDPGPDDLLVKVSQQVTAMRSFKSVSWEGRPRR